MTLTAPGFFITGTDTGVGKTLIACALLHALGERDLRVVGMKPVAAGGRMVSGRFVNEDVIALEAASTIRAPRELVNPYCFGPPIAPHIAAAEAGIPIDLDHLGNAYTQLASLADYVIVEGAGGFRVPLGAGYDTADLAVRLQLPVVLVVGVRLGCINHAVLTAAAVEGAGLAFAGWIANHIDPQMTHATQNVDTLRERLRAPLVGRVPYLATPAAAEAAEALDIDALFSSPRPDA